MSSWHSYPNVVNVGHRLAEGLTTHELNVESKIDGSQFSVALIDGSLRVRSKGKEFPIDAPEKMFTLACETVKALAPALHEGWTYRMEYLSKPKHNALTYSRVPKGHLILFDVNTDEEAYLPYEAKAQEAERLGLECVPLLASGHITLDDMRRFLTTESILGGTTIEGVVLKPRDYNLFGPDKKVIMAKFVSEAFKEVHAREWKVSNPSGKDIIQLLVDRLKTEARWLKAVQHLRERGELENSPRDIGPLLKEIPADIEKEVAEDIKETLYRHYWPQIRRQVCHGFPEFYKNLLLQKQFSDDAGMTGKEER